MSKYYIAADGGGSKLQAVLYDESFNVIRTERASGVNTLFKPKETVRANIIHAIGSLLHGEDGPDITEVEACDVCLVGAGDMIEEVFSSFREIKQITKRPEPVIGLAAAFRTSGVLALSGTGSDAFVLKDGKCLLSVGGWGAQLGDEGSGYDIGLKSIKAAIYSFDGRGEKTALYDLVLKKWDADSLWKIVFHLAGNPDARHEIASAALLCSRAAAMGDPVALRIYEQAAEDMVLTVRTAIDRCRKDWDGSVTVMGGAWRGSERMFDTFRSRIKSLYPEAQIGKPVFEPVIGCAVLRMMDEGRSPDELREPMMRGFKDFLYK